MRRGPAARWVEGERAWRNLPFDARRVNGSGSRLTLYARLQVPIRPMIDMGLPAGFARRAHSERSPRSAATPPPPQRLTSLRTPHDLVRHPGPGGTSKRAFIA